MDENIKTSKLDNRLEINPTDYAIETYSPVFKEGRKHTIVPLKISGSSILKGSKVFFMKKSKFEIKSQNRMRTIWKWYKQASKNTRLNPVVIAKGNSRDPLAILNVDHFFDLIK